MATVSKTEYDALLEERPRKFDAEQVGYERSTNDEEKCANCVHLYSRVVDKFHTCELFRNAETDRVGVMPNWKCSFFTRDGETFPLLDE